MKSIRKTRTTAWNPQHLKVKYIELDISLIKHYHYQHAKDQLNSSIQS